MPLGDGTGPAGRGPRTGRGMGSCSPNSERANFSAAGGFRKGRGGKSSGGFGRRFAGFCKRLFSKRGSQSGGRNS